MTNKLLGLLLWLPVSLLNSSVIASTPVPQPVSDKAVDGELVGRSALDRRIAWESLGDDNPFLILPHRPSYILPLTYNDDPIDSGMAGESARFDKVEAKFQVSFKIPLWDNIFADNGQLYFAYTQLSLWQMYNSELSSPFRESNYEPEFFLSFDTDFNFAGLTNRFVQFGLVHQSNGRGELLSRSWNRVYLNFIAERKNLVLSFKPWYRLPDSAEHDDNPDIDDFMGHAELRMAYIRRGKVFSLMLRNNFDLDDNNTAVELSWDFPLSGKLRAYIQYFNGYGETLLDYNRSVNRIGFGLAMSTWL